MKITSHWRSGRSPSGIPGEDFSCYSLDTASQRHHELRRCIGLGRETFPETLPVRRSLATIYPGTARVECDFSNIGWEKAYFRTALMDISLEVVMHAKQFKSIHAIQFPHWPPFSFFLALSFLVFLIEWRFWPACVLFIRRRKDKFCRALKKILVENILHKQQVEVLHSIHCCLVIIL